MQQTDGFVTLPLDVKNKSWFGRLYAFLHKQNADPLSRKQRLSISRTESFQFHFNFSVLSQSAFLHLCFNVWKELFTSPWASCLFFHLKGNIWEVTIHFSLKCKTPYNGRMLKQNHFVVIGQAQARWASSNGNTPLQMHQITCPCGIALKYFEIFRFNFELVLILIFKKEVKWCYPCEDYQTITLIFSTKLSDVKKWKSKE